MKLIIQYYDLYLQKRTEKIDIQPLASSSQLLDLISNKIGNHKNTFLATCKREGYHIRIIDGWTLEDYELKEGQIITVELRETEEVKVIQQERVQSNMKMFKRLGLGSNLTKIQEDNEEQEEEQTKTKPSKANYSSTEDDEVQEQQEKTQTFQEELVKIIKNGEIQKLKDQLMLNKKIYLINEIHKSGWYLIHYAVFHEQIEIIKYLIQQNIDLNTISVDGWLPIQLAVHKNNQIITQVLLATNLIEVNQVTPRGLTLNIACQNNNVKIVELLLEANADPNLKDEAGFNAFDVSNGDQLSRLLQESNKRQFFLSQCQKLRNESLVFVPPKPPIVKGYMYRQGSLIFKLNYRYFVLNPDEGTFIRYKSKSQCPMNPLEVIPVSDIRNVKTFGQQWFQRSQKYYFEMYYSCRQVFCCDHQNATLQWVYYLFQAAAYSNYLETLVKRGESAMIDSSNTTELDIVDDIHAKPPPLESQKHEHKNQSLYDKMNEEKKLSQDTKSDRKSEETGRISNLSAPPIQNEQRKKSPPTSDNSIMNTSLDSSISTDPENQQIESQLLADQKVNFKSFDVIKKLGSGAFGKVFLVKKLDTGKLYAMKALKKRQLIAKRQLKYAVTEANILKQCNHPFILSSHFSFQTPQHLYMVLDYCQGGDLATHLLKMGRFSEEISRFYIAELLLAIDYLHKMNVVYRDLKPENILLAEDGHIKLADFGLAKDNIADNDKAKSFCGSHAYLSPEVLSHKGATKASDIYGIGAVLYEFLTGEPPYYSEDIPTLYKNIKEGNLKFPNYINEDAKNLLKKLLERDPNKRLGAKDKNDIKKEPFFRSIDWDGLLNKSITAPIRDFTQDDDDDDYEELNRKKIFVDYDYEAKNMNVNRVIDFSFIKKY